MTDAAAANPATREEIEAMHRADAWTPPQLLARLDALGLETATHEHDPMWTVEDSQRLREDDSEEGHCKSESVFAQRLAAIHYPLHGIETVLTAAGIAEQVLDA